MQILHLPIPIHRLITKKLTSDYNGREQSVKMLTSVNGPRDKTVSSPHSTEHWRIVWLIKKSEKEWSQVGLKVGKRGAPYGLVMKSCPFPTHSFLLLLILPLSSVPFPAFSLSSLAVPESPVPNLARGLGELCEFVQRVQAESRRQTISSASWAENHASRDRIVTGNGPVTQRYAIPLKRSCGMVSSRQGSVGVVHRPIFSPDHRINGYVLRVVNFCGNLIFPEISGNISKSLQIITPIIFNRIRWYFWI